MKSKKASILPWLAAMAAAAVLLFLFVPGTSASAASGKVPSGARQYKGHTYYVYSGSVSWSEAKKQCEAKGGHLATITSSAENEFVKGLVNDSDVGYCWLGATDADSEGTWTWVTGEKFDFTDWHSGQPDDYNSEEDYLSTWTGTQWNDFPESDDDVKGYVCEWDMTKKEAGKVRLNQTSMSVKYGSKTTLKVLNSSSKAAWSSSKKSVASVNSKGVVTAKGIGKATITAKVGKTKLTCTVTVKDVNAAAEVTFTTKGGGHFICDISSATAQFKVPDSACGKATVAVVDADDKTVYSKKFTSVKKNKSYSFQWDGKNKKGKYKTGSYRIKVTIGNEVSYSDYLTLEKGGDFAGGNGSKSNPFKVSSLEQLKKIEQYNGSYFIQTQDIDCGYETLQGFFAESNPFTGKYNGNGKSISNLFLSNANSNEIALFIQTDASAEISNVTLKNVYVTGTNYVATLVRKNCGKVKNCKLDNCTVSSNLSGAASYSGLLVQYNETDATVSGCSITNSTISASYGWYHGWTGGIVGENAGSVMDCTISDSLVSTTSRTYGWTHGSALVAYNRGTMLNCVATRVTLEESSGNCEWSGAIAATNDGTIINCSFVDGTADNPGIEFNNGTFTTN